MDAATDKLVWKTKVGADGGHDDDGTVVLHHKLELHFALRGWCYAGRCVLGGQGLELETPAGTPEAQTAFSGRTAWVRNLETPLRTFLRTETGSAAVLLAGVIAALV